MAPEDTSKVKTNMGRRRFRRIGFSFEDKRKARGLRFSDNDPGAVKRNHLLNVVGK